MPRYLGLTPLAQDRAPASRRRCRFASTGLLSFTASHRADKCRHVETFRRADAGSAISVSARAPYTPRAGGAYKGIARDIGSLPFQCQPLGRFSRRRFAVLWRLQAVEPAHMPPARRLGTATYGAPAMAISMRARHFLYDIYIFLWCAGFATYATPPRQRW